MQSIVDFWRIIYSFTYLLILSFSLAKGPASTITRV